jgi:hypothetical protein
VLRVLPKSKIEKIVTRVITHDEKLGNNVGGSGHRGYTSFVINTLGNPARKQYKGKDAWELTYNYTIIIETEFTYYPDNPPREYKYQKTLIIDQNGRVLKELPKKAV